MNLARRVRGGLHGLMNPRPAGPDPGSALLDELRLVADSLARSTRDDDTVAGLRALTASAQRVFGARAVSIAVLDEDESTLTYVAATGEGAERIVGMTIGVGGGIAGWVLGSGQAIAISDVSRDSRFDRATAESTGYVPTAMMVAPLWDDEEVVGVMSVLDRSEDRDDAASDLETIAAWTSAAATCVVVARRQRRMRASLFAALSRAADDRSSLAEALRHGAAASPRDRLAAVSALTAELVSCPRAELDRTIRVIEALREGPRRP